MVNSKEIFDWKSFLTKWNKELWERLDEKNFADLGSEVIDSKWFGYPEAKDSDISAVEARLGKTLPPSYRSFLTISNGWQKVSPLIDRLYKIQKIDCLVTIAPDLIEAWLEGCRCEGDEISISDEEYFVYGDEQSSTSLRNEYLAKTLKIGGEKENGDPNNGILLLNPEIIFENGEWEVWSFAPWRPGAIRYKSFIELIEYQHESILEDPKIRELS